MPLEGFTPYAKKDAKKYNRLRWWLGMTWGDLFDKATDIYPDKIGLVDGTGRWTYGELREKVDRLAISLMKLGIKPRDWVLLQFPNWHEYILTFFAMQKIGAADAAAHPPAQSVGDQPPCEPYETGGLDCAETVRQD